MELSKYKKPITLLSYEKMINETKVDHLEKLLEEVIVIAKEADTEEDLKIEFEKKLEAYFKAKPIDPKRVKKIPKAKHEVSLFKGRADAVYGVFIIEYKTPGSLITLNVQRTGLKELRKYFIGLTSGKRANEITTEIKKLKTSKVNGVIFDGKHIIFVKPKRGKDIKSPLPDEKQIEISAYFPNLKKNELSKDFPSLTIDGPFEINKSTLDIFLQNLKSLDFKIITTSNLIESFGLQSELGIRFIKHLIKCLKESLQKDAKNRKVKLLFDEWSRVQGIVYGKDFDKSKDIINKVFSSFTINHVTLKEILFCVHTYFSILIKYIVAEILTYQRGDAFSEQFSKNFILLNEKQAFTRLEILESGKFYKDQGIKNFLEAIYLRWYLEVWDDVFFTLFRELSKEMVQFQPVSLYLEPDLTRDVLKGLYEDLVPKDIRHDLGEYYTPDWLAELAIKNINLEIDLDLKVLDPACGSGTFLVELIKLKRLIGEKNQESKNLILNKILETVVGFDINPIAVLTARTNFLLSIANLLQDQEIAIPVYLCDSIAIIDKISLQSIGDNTEEKVSKNILEHKTSEGTFKIHKDIIQKEIIEPLMEDIKIFVKKREDPSDFIDILKLNYKISEECFDSIEKLYTQILILDRQGKNGIWANILKNLFIPYSLGKFDVIVGNPPWIQFEYLAVEYREKIKDLWDLYNLMIRDPRGKTFGGAMAEGNSDFSILFSYVVSDQYLKKGGILSFIISQKVFNMRLGGAGFRHFNIPNAEGDIPLKVLEAHDFTSFKPFPGAANKTGLIIWQKNAFNSYPVSYYNWQRKVSRKSIYAYYNLEEVCQIIEPVEFQAQPIDLKNNLSPWQIAKNKDEFEFYSLMKGNSDYKGQNGVHPSGANGIYIVKLIRKINTKLSQVRNIPDEGRNKKIKEISNEVNNDLLHRVVLGRNIEKWKINFRYHIIIPHTAESGWKAIDEKTLKTKYTKTYLFLENFKEFLEKRPKYIKRRPSHPYYILLDIRENTFSDIKVILRTMGNHLTAAVSEDMAIPFKTTTYISLDNLDEAYYLCGIMNAEIIESFVESYSPKGRSFGSPHIFDNIKIPKFNDINDLHKEISRLSKEAHLIKKRKKSGDLNIIENEINEKVKNLFKK